MIFGDVWFFIYNLNSLMVIVMNKIRRQKYPLISFKSLGIAMVLPCLLYFCPFALAEVGHEADNGVVVPDVGVVEHLNKVRFDGTLFNEPYLLGKSGTKGGSGFVESLSAGQLNSKPICQEGSDKSSNNSEASGDNGQIVRGEFYFHGIKFTIWSYVLFLLIAYIPIECVIAWIFSKFLFFQHEAHRIGAVCRVRVKRLVG